MTEKNAVITLGIDSRQPDDHPQRRRYFMIGIARIRRALLRQRFCGALMYWTKTYPEGCPPHEAVPYGFKPFCFYAAHARGCGRILWIDSSIRIRGSLAPLFDLIYRDGYLIFNGSHSVGAYCKDAALDTLHITREESFRIPCCSASVIGLDLRQERAAEFLQRWKGLALDGVTFPGPKYNGCNGWPRTISDDPRVKGHRHDQTAASVLALQLGMDNWQSRARFSGILTNERRSIPKVSRWNITVQCFQLRSAAERLLGAPRLKDDDYLQFGSRPAHPAASGETVRRS
jgi:hypothetical protein